ALDLVHHLLRRRTARALAIDRAAEIVDHKLGAFARRRERDLAADAAPGPSDDDNLSFEGLTHRVSSPTPFAIKLGTRLRRGQRSANSEWRIWNRKKQTAKPTIPYSLFS